MNTESYRLIKGKLHRFGPNMNQFQTIKRGDVFVPTDDELACYKLQLEGPIAPEILKAEQEVAARTAQAQAAGLPVPAAAVANQSPEQRAEQDLARNLNGIRDVIRQADAAYLAILHSIETKRQPAPRVKVIQMLERRLRLETQASASA